MRKNLAFRWRRSYTVAILAAIAAAFLVLWIFNVPAWLVYWSAGYTGDGVLKDGGAWSYPRYRIEFPPLKFEVGATRTYHAEGIPPVKMLAGIGVVVTRPPTNDGSADDIASAIPSNAVLRLRIQTESGDVLYDHQKPVHEWNHAVSTRNVSMARWVRVGISPVDRLRDFA